MAYQYITKLKTIIVHFEKRLGPVYIVTYYTTTTNVEHKWELNSQNPSHISPSMASYVVTIVNNLEKTDRDITWTSP